MTRINSIAARQIFDSRGLPTLTVRLETTGGAIAEASVPSGASTGAHEAVELRDGDPKRFGGKGVDKAIANVNGPIANALAGMSLEDQAAIDRRLIDLDGTSNKGKLGANAILGVSMAAARAAAMTVSQPLYRHLGGAGAVRLPVPCMNVLNGGKHADNNVDFQEFMIAPVGAPSFAEAMRYGAETYQALKALLHDRGLSTAVGDEGGFAPDLGSNEEACAVIVEAIERAGYRAGEDIAIALDPAASSFAVEGGYRLAGEGDGVTSAKALLAIYEDWVKRYPIVSIEDGFGEDDWAGFIAQTEAQGGRIQIVGDDNFVTNPTIIKRGIAEKVANAALIKLNQIGTVTETVEAIRLCFEAGWGAMVSHRSGETTDDFIADFTVAMGTGQLKSGAPCRGERLAKYNRLMAIEAELGDRAQYSSPFKRPPHR
ncbi:enolase [Hephaestia caeni]|uniref:Enolase n=1 Tax=Hephaestia caeni TaxID=645617 RepID=A0A397PE76_9SPHN|nr:phosphopyruvate hydratase [Hephaestia caeni]RIA46713.1 enolase [Hephaestia caeni]